MDLLESGDEREVRPLGARLRSALVLQPPRWAVLALAVAGLATLAAGVVGAGQVRQDEQREAARVEVDVRVTDTSSSTVRGVARGAVDLLLVNRRGNRATVGDLLVDVEGLRVLRVEPELDRPLGAFEERPVRVVFVVPDCSRLVLPGTLSVSLLGDDQPPQRRELPVFDPAAGGHGQDGVALGACPPGSGGAEPGGATDVAARPAGGGARRVGPGADGFARLEVRNVGDPVRLLSVDARVPGVRFTPLVLDGGLTLPTEGLTLVRLLFTIEDCAQLEKTGSLLLRVERFGGVQELRLDLTDGPAAQVGTQVRLPVVLDACD